MQAGITGIYTYSKGLRDGEIKMKKVTGPRLSGIIATAFWASLIAESWMLLIGSLKLVPLSYFFWFFFFIFSVITSYVYAASFPQQES